MILLDLQDVFRIILGAHRVQFLLLRSDCSSLEASALDFQFRDRLYENYDYTVFAREMMDAVPEDTVMDYKDSFGLHYLVFRGRNAEAGSCVFFGPFLYHSYGEEDFGKMAEKHALSPNSVEAIRWYFKRIPIIHDYLSWQQMLSGFLARYLANPGLEIVRVVSDRPARYDRKPPVALSAIPYTTVEARYEVERAMLDAIARGDIAEATYQQNLFMGFSLDRRVPDRLRDVKDMIIAVNTLYRKSIEHAAVHPLYIDGLSGQFVAEIEAAENPEQVQALIPKMIRHYCLLVQQHSLATYSAVVRDCLNYIDFHYMEPLSLETLASRFSVNKNYLSSRFHKEVGRTVTDYINQIRVNRAAALLRHSSLTIQQIAEQCGFADGNYFTRIFKKLQDVTPNEYRGSSQPAGQKARARAKQGNKEDMP